MTDTFVLWQGIYENFDAALADGGEAVRGEPFLSDQWIEGSLKKIRDNYVLMADGKSNPDTANLHEHPLLTTLGILVAEREKVRVLDFGGGLGVSVPRALAALPKDARVEFVIVDNAQTCIRGRELFATEPRISFREDLPNVAEDFDLVYCGSSLQYVDDWLGVLKLLTSYGTDYLLLCDLQAGDIPSFTTLQVYYEHLIPVHFWNLDMFIGEVSALGYKSVLKSNFLKAVRGKIGPLPMQEFPADHRLDYNANVLFKASS